MERLAINGGPKAIPQEHGHLLKWPKIGQEEFSAIRDLLDMERPDYKPYDFYNEMVYLEQEFASYMGVKYALSENNGTAAIHSGFFALGIQPGEEVIAPTYTYWATSMPARVLGARIVFAESDPDTLCIDAADIRRKITPKTRAIAVTHVWGIPCQMDEIMNIAREYNLKVLEDAAHVPGGEYKGRKVGTIGDVGCFSFQASKILPAIEGGMLVTNDKELWERAVVFGHYGFLTEKNRPGKDSPYSEFNSTGLGFKYRIHPIAAAIARIQLRKLDENNAKREACMGYLTDGLEKIPGIRVIKAPPYTQRTYWGFRIAYKATELNGLDKDKFLQALRAEGVMCEDERYELQHQQMAYRVNIYGPKFNHTPFEKKQSLPRTEALKSTLIGLPAFPEAPQELMEQYIYAFDKVTAQVDEVAKITIKNQDIAKPPDKHSLIR